MSVISLHNPAKRFAIRTIAFMSGYVAVNTAAIFGAFDDAKGLGAWALALVVSAPVAGQIWALLAYMKEADEYVRALLTKRFVVATGITMGLACAWGFMESYAHAYHVPAWMIFPLFWLAFASVTPFIKNSH